MVDPQWRIQRLWNTLKESRAKTRAHFAIPRDHIEHGDQLKGPFRKDEHYFQFIINEMFLAHDRIWFTEYAPMAYVTTNYRYSSNEKPQTVQFLAGPNILNQFKQDGIPRGMIFRNTPVSPLHPYRGGAVTFTIILNKLQRQNYAEKLLQVVERLAGAVDPTQAFTAYLSVAHVLLDSIEALLDLRETMPVLGYRETINPDIGHIFQPTYYVIIDEDEHPIEHQKFWVRNSRLHYGQDLETSQPYNYHDFILFSIVQATQLSDLSTLPFYPQWQTTEQLARMPQLWEVPQLWEDVAAHYRALVRSIWNSPDLTKPDRKRVIDDFRNQLDELKEQARKVSRLGQKALPEEEAAFQRMFNETARLA